VTLDNVQNPLRWELRKGAFEHSTVVSTHQQNRTTTITPQCDSNWRIHFKKGSEGYYYFTIQEQDEIDKGPFTLFVSHANTMPFSQGNCTQKSQGPCRRDYPLHAPIKNDFTAYLLALLLPPILGVLVFFVLPMIFFGFFYTHDISPRFIQLFYLGVGLGSDGIPSEPQHDTGSDDDTQVEIEFDDCLHLATTSFHEISSRVSSASNSPRSPE